MRRILCRVQLSNKRRPALNKRRKCAALIRVNTVGLFNKKITANVQGSSYLCSITIT